MPDRRKFPRPTVQRLSLYLRELEALPDPGRPTISSRQLGQALGFTDAQVRKDLACFGQFGQPGLGYRVAELVQQLRKILGTDRLWAAVVVGAGNVGRAILSYDRLRRKGFDIVAAFDNNPDLTGAAIEGRRIQPLANLQETVRTHRVMIGIVAVPTDAAQHVAEQLINAGVRGILNFAPVRLILHPSFPVVNVDVTVSLEQLAFGISTGTPAPAEASLAHELPRHA